MALCSIHILAAEKNEKCKMLTEHRTTFEMGILLDVKENEENKSTYAG